MAVFRLLIVLSPFILSLGVFSVLANPPNKVNGYRLSPLESYIIDAFAEHEVRTFITTGNSILFDHPKVFYVRSKPFAMELRSSAKDFEKKYLNQYIILNSLISEVTPNHRQFKTFVSQANVELSYSAAANAEQRRLNEVSVGQRSGFYCRVSAIKTSAIELSDCLPDGQYKRIKMNQIANGIKQFLTGQKTDDPNMPTYAMLAYTAVVSAKLLPKNSVCRQTVSEEVSYTSAEMRLCNQEITRLWENAGVNSKFDETMDAVQEQFQRDGIDVRLLSQAAGSLD